MERYYGQTVVEETFLISHRKECLKKLFINLLKLLGVIASFFAFYFIIRYFSLERHSVQNLQNEANMLGMTYDEYISKNKYLLDKDYLIMIDLFSTIPLFFALWGMFLIGKYIFFAGVFSFNLFIFLSCLIISLFLSAFVGVFYYIFLIFKYIINIFKALFGCFSKKYYIQRLTVSQLSNFTE